MEEKYIGGICSKKTGRGGSEEVITLPCIIHQQTFCSKWLKFDAVTSGIGKCINHPDPEAWSTGSVTPFCRKESQHMQMCSISLTYIVLARVRTWTFFELRAEVQASMEKDGIIVRVTSDPKLLIDLTFIVDIRQNLNVLYKKFQGQLVIVVCDIARVFSKNLVLWKVQLSLWNLCHFTACKAFMQLNCKTCADTIVKLQDKCDYRFWDFRHRASIVENVPYASDGANFFFSILNSKPSSGRWVEKQKKLGLFLQKLPPPSHCRMFKQNMLLFWSTCAQWTLISQS